MVVADLNPAIAIGVDPKMIDRNESPYHIERFCIPLESLC
jgi:hypothetical protein